MCVCVFAGGGSNWKTFGQVVSENLGHGDKADYFTTKATLMVLKKDNCMYQVSGGAHSTPVSLCVFECCLCV